MNIPVKIKYVSSDIDKTIYLPKYATAGAAGMDLAASTEEPITIQPGKRAIIPTGISIQLPSNEYVALIFARSGLGIKHGITMSNGVGVIDSDYRGEIMCGLINLGDCEHKIHPGDRIAQMVFMPVVSATLIPVGELSDTDRGTGGLGSTGY